MSLGWSREIFQSPGIDIGPPGGGEKMIDTWRDRIGSIHSQCRGPQILTGEDGGMQLGCRLAFRSP
jgi:hypothetical protein